MVVLLGIFIIVNCEDTCRSNPSIREFPHIVNNMGPPESSSARFLFRSFDRGGSNVNYAIID